LKRRSKRKAVRNVNCCSPFSIDTRDLRRLPACQILENPASPFAWPGTNLHREARIRPVQLGAQEVPGHKATTFPSSDQRLPIGPNGYLILANVLGEEVVLEGNHLGFEGFEVTAGSSRCIFHHTHDVVLRDLLVRSCPAHGILSADEGSGSLTLEYSEIAICGNGSTQHSLYITSDQNAYPDFSFRM
jgi:hypothetical protein